MHRPPHEHNGAPGRRPVGRVGWWRGAAGPVAASLLLTAGLGLAAVPVIGGTSLAGASSTGTSGGNGSPSGSGSSKGAAPSFTSPSNVTIASGAARTITITASGTPTPTITETGGSLPPGMSFHAASGSGTATIAGTPKPAGSSYTVDLKAESSAGSATQQLVITFSNYGSAPSFTSPARFVLSPHQYAHVTVRASGTPTPQLQLQGALPPDLVFHQQADGTATISGYLHQSSQSSWNVTVTATNGKNPPAVQHLSLVLAEPVAFTSPANQALKPGAYETVRVTAKGSPTPKLTESGALPPGMSFHPDDENGTATIAGQVAGSVRGTYHVVLTATNGVGAPVHQDLALTFSQAPAITSPSQLTVKDGQSVHFTIHASGIPAPKVTEQGVLPAGLHFYSGHGIAVIAGTPHYGLSGTSTIEVVAANGAGPNATQQLHLTDVAAAPPTVPGGKGYWYVTSTGRVLWKGQARPIAPAHPQAPREIVGMATTPDEQGYYLVSSFGGVFSYGDATFHGSITHLHLRTPTVALGVTPSGKGYFEVTRAGNVFRFGDAHFYGSTAGKGLPPIVAFGVSPDGHGYWLVSERGNVYNFGDAHFYGSAARLHLPPIAGFAPTPDGKGYWLVTTTGHVVAFGDATSYGSPARRIPPVTAFAATGNGRGYWIVTARGNVFSFGDAHFFGSSARSRLPGPVEGFAPQL